MKRLRPSRSLPASGNPSAHGAFTLVELVTAASIMTIIMIGVVEIFAVVTQTAAEAEAIHGAHQQMRATFDRLNRDLRGITPEGYLKITTTTNGNYHTDALAFVSVGRHTGIYDPENCQAGAAEILYTTHVRTPNNFLTIDSEKVDARRGILARSTWLMGGTVHSTPLTLDELEKQDTSNAAWLGELFGSPVKARPVGPTKVVPFLPATGASPDDSVRRVMTTCTSEFFVEYWDGANWQHKTKTFNPGDSGWPRAIRVTLAVHDPDDRGPLPAGGRYKGYALQEVFYIGAR